jgi:phosphotransacetylase
MRLGETPEALALKAAQEALEATAESREAKEIQDTIAKLKTDITIVMGNFGYQDVECGWYALYQRRITDTYSPELVKANLPKQASMLIEETVNKTALEGLIKGKLITQEQANNCIDLAKRKEVLVPIIKVA